MVISISGAVKCIFAAAIASVSTIGISARAQSPVQSRGTSSGNSSTSQLAAQLAKARSSFDQAAKIMEGALPIYDGHVHRAIQLAKLASQQVTAASLEAANGTSGYVAPHRSPAQQAAMIPKGASNVPVSRFNAAQVYASNSEMQQSMNLLQQGLQILRAIGNDPANHMKEAAEYCTMAGQAANMGLTYVTGQ